MTNKAIDVPESMKQNEQKLQFLHFGKVNPTFVVVDCALGY